MKTTAIKKTVDFYKLIDRFLADQDIKPITKKCYAKNLKEFFNWLIENNLVDPARRDILNYKAYLIKKKLSSLTISLYLVTVRRFFQWLNISTGYIDPTRQIKGMKRIAGFNRDSLSRDQALKLLSAVDKTTLIGKRDHALICLMLYTGLRTIEISRALIEDIRQNNNKTCLYIQGKGKDDKLEFVILNEFVLTAINDYMTARGIVKNSDPLFAGCSNRNRSGLTTTIISMTIKKHLRSIGLNNPRLTAHSLRHSTATFCLQGGGSLQEAQQLLRHVSINTTMIYSHNLDRLTNAGENAVENYLQEAV